jgi:hypothetical protein
MYQYPGMDKAIQRSDESYQEEINKQEVNRRSLVTHQDDVFYQEYKEVIKRSVRSHQDEMVYHEVIKRSVVSQQLPPPPPPSSESSMDNAMRISHETHDDDEKFRQLLESVSMESLSEVTPVQFPTKEGTHLVVSNGNCMPDAIRLGIIDAGICFPFSTLAMRKIAMMHLRQNSERFENYFITEETMEQYIARMGRDTVWGDQILILLLALVFNITIHVVEKDRVDNQEGFSEIINPGYPIVYLCLRRHHYTYYVWN